MLSDEDNKLRLRGERDLAIPIKFIAAVVGCAVLAGAGFARAEGGYVGAGGANLGVDPTARLSDADLRSRSGIGAFGAVGYRWDDMLSTEVEGGLRFRNVDGAAEATNGRGANESTKLLMVNARLAPPVRGPIKPYAGVGAGLAIVSTADHSLRSEDDDMSAAGQAMAGFSYDVSSRTSLYAEYRYFKLLEDQGSSGAGGGSRRHESHIGFLGLRVKLGGFR